MKEEFLHHIWAKKQFDARELFTTDGEPITIYLQGELNQYSGPDFSGARIKIGEQLWAGNVEIHIRSSDWNRHGHETDPAYENVILHVVFIHDEEVKINSGRILPTLELRGKIFADFDRFEDSKIKDSNSNSSSSRELHSQYSNFRIFQSSNARRKEGSLSCGDLTSELKMESVSMMTRSLTERLERKTIEIKEQLAQCNGDWEEAFYRVMLQHCGMKVNSDPFRWLAQITPWKLLAKYRHDVFQLEALLFGQAGMLGENAQLSIEDDKKYFLSLQSEYAHLSRLHALEPMNVQSWKYMRLRPNNFPTIRISQLAALFSKEEKLFRACMENENAEELRTMLEVHASEYWDTHYRFDVESRNYRKKFGEQVIDVLFINAIAPMKFLYGKELRNETYVEEAIAILEKIPAEKNSIVLNYERSGWEMKHAADTQGILELKRNYCDRKKCLDCEVGRKVLNRRIVAHR
ncbi:MAG TPA: DUF2851 family protein [Bacteroidia bacterium]|jgi:hypothetical protein|nr:DUF2851 family protein [Bacteroidia bacterium]